MEGRREEIRTHLAAAVAADLVRDGGAVDWARGGGAGPHQSARSESGGSCIRREIDTSSQSAHWNREIEIEREMLVAAGLVQRERDVYPPSMLGLWSLWADWATECEMGQMGH
jgi:hypothetical protein